MNGREKSDPGVVAVKPANKAGLPAAEWVEPRTGTEGKAIQQSAFRTPGRGDASQALERIRQAARRNRKEKFTALLHHVTVEKLEEAFRGIAKDAAAGVDGIEAFYERCIANDVTILTPLRPTAWGTKDFYVEDPDGYIIAFGGRPSAA